MTELHMNNLKILIKKLSNHARVALEKSANSCINQQNYEIEIEHFFLELLEQSEPNDLHLLVEKYKISHDFLVKDLQLSLSQLPKGNTRTPIFAQSIIRLLEQAWLLASAEQTTKKTTVQVAKPKKVEKAQSTEVASKPNTNPFNSL